MHAPSPTSCACRSSERHFPLPQRTPKADVLAHLHLLVDNQPTNAAVLLFGSDPRRFLSSAEVRCMHFHGTEIRRPRPLLPGFPGPPLQAGRSCSRLRAFRAQSQRRHAHRGAQAPVAYEIPPDVVREAIVNAVAHRDYALAGGVQVSVFADRVEVWNPGVLPPPLTLERLRQPHGSVPRNARICEALFLARYIEKYGTGTLMMIRESVEHSLPEPDFAERAGELRSRSGAAGSPRRFSMRPISTSASDWSSPTLRSRAG